jgi:hypothetical protein
LFIIIVVRGVDCNVKAAKDSATPQRGTHAKGWDTGPEADLPPARTASGDPSAVGLKAKFEMLANPPPPKKTMGKVTIQI